MASYLLLHSGATRNAPVGAVDFAIPTDPDSDGPSTGDIAPGYYSVNKYSAAALVRLILFHGSRGL